MKFLFLNSIPMSCCSLCKQNDGKRIISLSILFLHISEKMSSHICHISLNPIVEEQHSKAQKFAFLCVMFPSVCTTLGLLLQFSYTRIHTHVVGGASGGFLIHCTLLPPVLRVLHFFAQFFLLGLFGIAIHNTCVWEGFAACFI